MKEGKVVMESEWKSSTYVVNLFTPLTRFNCDKREERDRKVINPEEQELREVVA